MLMSVLHRLGRLQCQTCRCQRRERSTRKPLLETTARHKSHREVWLAVNLADVVNRHDAGMVELGRGPRLVVETLNSGR